MTMGRTLSTMGLLMVLVAPTPALAQTGAAPAIEHPVIKAMTGATLLRNSKVEEFGRMPVTYRDGARNTQREVEGRLWHLEYQLSNRQTGRGEIMANYEAEAKRVGGAALSRTATRMLLRLPRPGGTYTWCRIEAKANGAYDLDIVDEAGLDLSLEFDADALLAALNRDGQVAIYGVLFDVDKADLRPGSGAVFDTIATILKNDATLRLEVQGHTDSTGTPERNRALSLLRAQAVVNGLALYGVDRARLAPRGLGADQPVGDNATEEGRQQNRRVMLVKRT
jgi:outer membrane protein OmpA-like peptidoglycan-associated protein